MTEEDADLEVTWSAALYRQGAVGGLSSWQRQAPDAQPNGQGAGPRHLGAREPPAPEPLALDDRDEDEAGEPGEGPEGGFLE